MVWDKRVTDPKELIPFSSVRLSSEIDMNIYGYIRIAGEVADGKNRQSQDSPLCRLQVWHEVGPADAKLTRRLDAKRKLPSLYPVLVHPH